MALPHVSRPLPGIDDTPPLLIVPGLGNSGADHWQSHWERARADNRRADLGRWDAPEPKSWIAGLDAAISAAARPVLLVAHSLGCHAVARWARQAGPHAARAVAGALLVAPPELDRGAIDPRLLSFAPASRDILPFPSVLVASRNDPYIDMTRARRLAFFWGSGFADAGAVGHINAESGLGDWSFGRFLLHRLGRPGAENPAGHPLPQPAFVPGQAGLALP